jgi:hypothetical protein
VIRVVKVSCKLCTCNPAIDDLQQQKTQAATLLQPVCLARPRDMHLMCMKHRQRRKRTLTTPDMIELSPCVLAREQTVCS